MSDDAVAQLMSVSGIENAEEARYLLEAANGDLNVALDFYFQGGLPSRPPGNPPNRQSTRPTHPARPARPAPKPAPQRTETDTRLNPKVAKPRVENAPVQPKQRATQAKPSATEKRTPMKAPTNVHGDLVNKVIDAAKNQANSENVPPASHSVVVTLYKNGFILSGSNEFRSLDVPKNKEFMETLTHMGIPEELSKYKDVDVCIDDKSSEVYEVKADPFAGRSATIKDSGNKAKVQLPNLIPNPVCDFSKGKESVRVMIKLPSSGALKLTVPKNTTIKRLKEFINQNYPLGVQNMILSTSLQCRVLANDSATMEQENLKNVQLILSVKS